MVFVTLLSRAGYLRQELDAEGRQIDHPDPWDPAEWATPLGAKAAVDIEGRATPQARGGSPRFRSPRR